MLTQFYTYHIESATIGKQRKAVPIIDAKQEHKRLFWMPVECKEEFGLNRSSKHIFIIRTRK